MAEINQELRALEIFEMEVLEKLNSAKMLENLYFGGGTMLRLCHNLNRYSTDLDFWLKPEKDYNKIFESTKNLLANNYEIVDSADKNFTLLFQLRSPKSKRTLKIEIRKEQTNFLWERKIAFSKFTVKQVQVLGLTLDQMMKNKVEALLSRKIIRDCFDIDFLFKRGLPLPEEKETLEKILNVIESFKERDFKVTLGSLLDPKERDLYNEIKFEMLKTEIIAQINT
ncbi:MAG: nucleotidyl transferase AbiEii/AbiGii toxin family protein [Melioribacteraceae bacterium]|nr:nucleotidyl transferase AbiEii/AbiGii toxin family protein [Melioribacteraceae bacterium]MCO6474780.1 nucleotidyl transferase AbiEii/AbiGii toxin family protein [Melioribacteraceae bacterium]